MLKTNRTLSYLRTNIFTSKRTAVFSHTSRPIFQVAFLSVLSSCYARNIHISANMNTNANIREIPAQRVGLEPDKYHVQLVDYADSIYGRHVIVQPIQNHTGTVILMHGLGDTALGWADPVFQHYVPAVGDQIKFILPTAPTQPVTLNMGMPMPSWYDIKSLDKNRSAQECDGIDTSSAYIRSLIERETTEHGISMDRIVLAGFSQGGALALYTGLQLSSTIGGICVKSGYLPGAANVQVTADSIATPIHFFHGRDDDVVRLEWGRESEAKVNKLGASNVKFLEYDDLPHAVNEKELSDVSLWLKSILPPLE